MLGQSGVDLGAPDLLKAWFVFKAFAAMPVDGVDAEDGDMCLFAWGVYDWHDSKGERFQIDFTRQFSVNDDAGEYDHMEQLHCSFYFEPTEWLRAYGAGSIWIAKELAKGFAEVEALPIFTLIAGAEGDLRLVEAIVEQWEV